MADEVLARGDFTCTNAQQLEGADNYGNSKWKVTLRSDDSGQEIHNVYTARKPENPIGPGTQVFGSVMSGQYGPRFKREQKDNAPGPVVTQQGSTEVRDYTGVANPPAPAAQGNDNFAAKERAKNRSIAYSVGLREATAIALAGLPDSGDKRLEEIKRMARVFADDSLAYARGE